MWKNGSRGQQEKQVNKEIKNLLINYLLFDFSIIILLVLDHI
jgi:hypothetical protein